MKLRSRLLLPAVLVFALPGAVLAQTGSDPALGTWMLNVAKSSYKPGPAPKSEMRTYESTPDGMIRLTVHQVAGDGSAVTQATMYKRDGKPYAFTGSASIDAVATTRVGARETRTKLMRQGKVIGNFSAVESKDGKTLTATSTFKTTSGNTEHDVRVYDRQ